ncbi:MAG: M48 family metallopeptidase [Halocynthiibacter sp.]
MRTYRSFGLALLSSLFMIWSTPSEAIRLIRDAEVEHALKRLAAPVLSQAGLPANRIKIMLVDNRAMNAFVIDSQHIFIYTGLIGRLKTAGELQAVIAHEAAHIANGHIARRKGNYGAARNAGAFGMLLAIGVAAAGAGDAAIGIAAGTQSAAQRAYFAHSRAEEASADRAALRYMSRAQIPTTAMVDLMELFRGQEALSSNRQDAYVLTHPLSRDRLRAIKAHASASSSNFKPNTSAEAAFATVQGKISAFLRPARWTLSRVKKTDKSNLAIMRRAVAYHRQPSPKKALKEINKLVADAPKIRLPMS